ncbi:hypothetical protein ABZ883_23480 [Streptomyces sp. NPDC046977]|uniref:hypothetical protein n=1 Tax=Streptomyces sp. NPDC046977 TaxID=3154703 RepID=UPI0033FBFB48
MRGTRRAAVVAIAAAALWATAGDAAVASVTFAKRGWTLTVDAGAWPGEPDTYDVVASSAAADARGGARGP